MILRKPYAFLIKYFRIIHLLLFGFLCVVLYKYSSIIKFFNDYIRNGYKTTIVTDLEKIYVPFVLYLCVFAVLLFSIIILILLKHKEKKYGLYCGIILYYVGVLLGLFYLTSVFKSFEFSLLASTASRSIRDILIIYYLPQYLILVILLVRVIGFNIKKFDFNDIRKEFDGDESDSEEVEISFKLDGHKLKRTINRTGRETIYYLKENKFVVIVLFVGLLLWGGIFIYKNTHGNYDSYYSMGREFRYKDFNVTIEDALLTNLDYNGNVIKTDKYYIVLKTNVHNDTGDSKTIDYNHFKLIIDGQILTPMLNYSTRFIDFAPDQILSTYAPNGKKTIALVYEISLSQVNKKAYLNVYNGSVYDKGEYLNKKIIVNIKSEKIDDVEIVSNYSLNEEITFDASSLGNTKFIVSQYFITKKYSYEYKICQSEEKCQNYMGVLTVPLKDNRQDNVLLILMSDYIQDRNSVYSKNNVSTNNFVDNFIKIQYRVNNEIYVGNAYNVTPQNAENFIAFELPVNIMGADIIQMIITIRDKQYIINLKS